MIQRAIIYGAIAFLYAQLGFHPLTGFFVVMGLTILIDLIVNVFIPDTTQTDKRA